MTLRWYGLLLSVGCMLALLPSGLAAQAGSFHRQFQVSAPVLLMVHNGSGDVRVNAMPGKVVTVDGEIRENFNFFFGPNPAAVQRIENNPPIQQNGNTIRIDRVPGDWARHISIRYTITAPADTEVQIETGSGDIDLNSLQRGARLQTGSGDLQISNQTGDVYGRTGSGDVRFSAIQGNADLATGSGDIRGRSVTGHLRVHTGSGDVSVEQAGQGAEAHTGSGGVELDQVAGDVSLSTGSGDVSVGGALHGHDHWDIGSGSGEIRIRLAGDSLAQARLAADSGDVRVLVPRRDTNIRHHFFSGVIGSASGTPAATLSVHSGSGDIVVH